nr:flavodoxin domain-containing protein [Methanobacterium formicicum]
MIRTLVLYESRYGSTWEAARIISLILGPSRRIPVSQFTEKHRDYDFIVMGAPIYMGKIHPKLQDFIDREKEWLNEKNIVLFCTCLDGSDGLRVLRKVEDDLGGRVMELGVLGGAWKWTV